MIGPAWDGARAARQRTRFKCCAPCCEREKSLPYAIVGHSYCSGLGLRFAYRFSNEVKGMVLTAASYRMKRYSESADTRIHGRSYFELYAWSTRSGLMRITPERYLPDM